MDIDFVFLLKVNNKYWLAFQKILLKEHINNNALEKNGVVTKGSSALKLLWLIKQNCKSSIQNLLIKTKLATIFVFSSNYVENNVINLKTIFC